jgi:co-chaperonin GroES (HSP10)
VNPRGVRPRRDWVLVLQDPRKVVLDSGLVLPGEETGAEKVTESSGTVARLGPSEHLVSAIDLVEGTRIVYRGFMKHHMPIPDHGETWEDGSKKEYFLMAVEDVIAVIGKDTSVGVFSRPSQKAVESVDDTGKVKMRR